ncbi:MAG: response regulator [Candidatus Sumerlaeota bacterium]|nr:response regulator [Candidatus Sumerlaeota bacterium]
MSDQPRKLRIFVVDESETYRHIIERTLANKFQNIHIETAENGEQALNMALNPPDLIITGLGMPVCDGFTMIERLRANPHTSQTPVLVVSQKDTPEAMTRLTRLGIQGFLGKPFAIEDLVINVEAILRRQIGRDAVEVQPRNAVRRRIESAVTLLFPVRALTPEGICAVLGVCVEAGAHFPAGLQEIHRGLRLPEPQGDMPCMALKQTAEFEGAMVVRPCEIQGAWMALYQSKFPKDEVFVMAPVTGAAIRLQVPARAIDLSASGIRILSPLAAKIGESLSLSLSNLAPFYSALHADNEVMGKVMRSAGGPEGQDLGLQFEVADSRLIASILRWTTAE